MDEEAFVDEQYIATEGEIGDKFYITVLGNVRKHAHVRRILAINLVDDRILPERHMFESATG